MQQKMTTRRGFLAGTATAAAAFSIIPRHCLGGQSHIAPSDKITHAIIGCGGIHGSHTGHIKRLSETGSQLISLCDVDTTHLAARKKGKKGVTGYGDFREMLAKEDIDVCHIATPPHWHALMAIAAAEAGCDVWCEKPMTRTIGESEAVRRTIQEHGRMLRINTWFRFQSNLYGMKCLVKPLKKLVMAGALGDGPITVRLSHHTGFNFKSNWQGKTDLPTQPIPKALNWDLWQGPAPAMPYNTHRCHKTFRGYWQYDSGGLGDMCQHYIDPVQYILGKDHTSPVRIKSHGHFPQHPEAVRPWGGVTMEYADGSKIIMESADSPCPLTRGKPFLEGSKGKIYPGFRCEPTNLRALADTLPDPEPMVTNFHESVRTRKPFALNEENGHRSNLLVHLADIAIRIPRELKFNPETLLFEGDEEANRLVHQPMRAPWRLPQFN